jgi:hypothetical protein
MTDCEFLHRFVDCHKQMQEVCSLNSRPCLVDPRVGDIKQCTRRGWALNGFHTQRPSGPATPPGKIDSHGFDPPSSHGPEGAA